MSDSDDMLLMTTMIRVCVHLGRIRLLTFRVTKDSQLLRASSSLVTFARLAWFSSKMGLGSGGNGMMTLEDGPLQV